MISFMTFFLSKGIRCVVGDKGQGDGLIFE
nr:MAG TPA: hypothetical protein [Caudoviricetes sp.]